MKSQIIDNKTSSISSCEMGHQLFLQRKVFLAVTMIEPSLLSDHFVTNNSHCAWLDAII